MAKTKEKKKPAAGILEHAFWGVLGITTIVAAVFWWFGTSNAADEYRANKNKITNVANLPKQIGPDEPNERSAEQLDELIRIRLAKSMSVWQAAYDKQVQYLTWPEIQQDAQGRVVQPGLTPAFLNAVKTDLVDAQGRPVPPEWLNLNGTHDLSALLREEFRNFGRTQIDELCRIMKSPYRLRPQTGREAEGEEDTDRLRPGELVDWVRPSQQMAADLLTFPEGVPVTLRVVYAQEDLWVHKSIAEVIARTNEAINAEGNYNAAVKRLLEIRTGKNYVELDERGFFRLREEESARRRTPTDEPEDDEPAAGSESGEPASQPRDPYPPLEQYGDKRYCDERGRWLSKEALQELRFGNPQFKRVPVLLRLDIDQRYLGILLDQFVNAPLTTEIRHVRVLVDDPVERFGGPMTAKATPARPPGQATPAADTRAYHDVTLDLHLFVYLYFPPVDPGKTNEADPAESAAQ
jgi:hypothetical protein